MITTARTQPVTTQLLLTQWKKKRTLAYFTHFGPKKTDRGTMNFGDFEQLCWLEFKLKHTGKMTLRTRTHLSGGSKIFIIVLFAGFCNTAYRSP